MKKSRMRRRGLTLGAMIAGIALVVSAGAGAAFGAGEALTVGSKGFASSQVLGQIYGQALAKKGNDVTFKENIGETEVVYAALKNGDIDMYPEYQGTLLEFLGGTATPDTTETYNLLKAKLAGTGIVATKPTPAIDANGFFVTKKTAKKYNLKNISDLKKVAPKLVFGGPPVCETRDLCLGPKSQQVYGLKFKEVKKLDVGGPLTVTALEDNDIQVGLLFGSSVLEKDFVALKDDKALQPAENVVVLIREDKATPAVVSIVNKVSAKVSQAAYNSFASKVVAEKQDPDAVATAFLKANKLS
jgi:osmoprotectant transport system substrate-binding protein